MSLITQRNGHDCIEAVSLHDIAARFGTPCYVYSRAALTAAFEAYRQTLAGRNVRIHFEGQDGSVRDVPAASLSHCETVFAMTIHKSQGSEFDDVLVHLPEGTDTPILTRELLYTGVTRARRRVLLQAGLDTLLHTTGQRVRRTSGLQERLGR